MDAFPINIRDIVIDFLESDDENGVVYEGNPTRIPGTMQISVTPTVASASLYGDGNQRDHQDAIGGYDVSLEHNKIPPPTRARMRGQKLDRNTGVYISNTKDVAKQFAIGWTVDLTGGHVEVTWLLKCKAVPTERTVEQKKGDAIVYSTDSLNITAMPLAYNNDFDYIADTSDEYSGFTHEKAATFFDKVLVVPPRSTVNPDPETPPEPGETKSGIAA